MAAIIPYVLFYLVTAVVCLVSAAYLYYAHALRYFKRRGIPSEPATFPFGNLGSVFAQQKAYSQLLHDLYKKYKGEKFVGFFQFLQKSVLIVDRDLIRNVLVKDYEYFSSKNIHYNRELEPVTENLFAIDGEEWKLLRTKMSPVFTTGKLKGMSQTVTDVGHQLTQYLAKLTAEDPVIECKEVFTRYGLANIASTAFGLESDVFTDKTSTFCKMAESILAPTLGGFLRNGLWFYGGSIAKALRIRIIPKKTHEFFMNLVKDTVEYRETHNKTRNDFLQLMMQLKEGTKVGDQEFSITMNEIAAQAYLFILAGFESSSNTMSFFLYEMALNPEVQKRVQAEVDAVEEVNYETLAGMEYLDMAVDETLRKYQPVGFLGRTCSKDYPVPGTNHVIEKGTTVQISTYGLHSDPDLFPEPEKFIPERFSKENKNNIKPFSYMPFGEGPRFCIAMRFGKMTVKAGLAQLLRQYEVQTTPNTPIPIKFETKTITTTAQGGMWLRFVDRRSPQTTKDQQ